MTAQPHEAEHVLKAFIFVVRYGDNGESHTEGACIAGNHDEAVAILKPRYVDFSSEVSFFNAAVSIMEPAMIERWHGAIHRIKEEGFYAFLKGFFFCKCGDYQKVAKCAIEESRTGWTACIYNQNHYIRPL